MADLKQKAFGTIASALTTELNSLTTGSFSSASSAIDNSTLLDIYDDLELVVTYGTNPTAGSVCQAFLIESADDTNYQDAPTSASGGGMLVATFELRATTSAQRIVVPRVMIPPGLFKYMLLNSAGQTTAASGNTLKRRPHSLQVT